MAPAEGWLLPEVELEGEVLDGDEALPEVLPDVLAPVEPLALPAGVSTLPEACPDAEVEPDALAAGLSEELDDGEAEPLALVDELPLAEGEVKEEELDGLSALGLSVLGLSVLEDELGEADGSSDDDDCCATAGTTNVVAPSSAASAKK